MSRLVHFEITGAEPGRLAQFYAQALDVRSEPSPFLQGYHMLVGGGPLGAVMDRTYKNQVTIVWFEVDDLDATVARVLAEGGSIAGDKNTIPGEGLVQYMADPQGTIFGIKQPLLRQMDQHQGGGNEERQDGSDAENPGGAQPGG